MALVQKKLFSHEYLLVSEGKLALLHLILRNSVQL